MELRYGTDSTFSGNANTATTLANTRTIAGNNFNGSQNVTISLNQLSDVNVGTPGSNQDDQVLAWDNANSEFSLTTVSTGGGGISDIVEDSSPQLGGNLNISEDNSTHHSIVSSNNGDIIFAPNGTGSLGVTSGSTLQAGPAGGVTNPSVIVEGVDVASSTVWVDHNSTTAGDSGNIVLSRSRADGVFGITAVADNDVLGNISFAGADGTDKNTIGAQIESRVDGTPGSNNMPAELVFHTNSGAATTTPRMFVRADGRVRIGPEINNGNLAASDAHLQVLGDIQVGQGNSIQFRANTHNNFVSLKCGGVSDVAGQAGYTLNLPGDRPTSTNRFLKLTGTTDTDDQEHTLEWAAVDTSKAGRIEHLNTTDGFTIGNDSNAAMVGPLTINSGQTITVGNANSVFKIL
jgi:hypothetical protein